MNLDQQIAKTIKEPCLMDLNGKLHFLDRDKFKPDPDDFVVDSFGEPVSYHYEIALQLIPDDPCGLDKLINQGWICIGSRFMPPYSHKEANQKQIDSLFDYGINKIIVRK